MRWFSARLIWSLPEAKRLSFGYVRQRRLQLSSEDAIWLSKEEIFESQRDGDAAASVGDDAEDGRRTEDGAKAK